jgi:hypothetical protein
MNDVADEVPAVSGARGAIADALGLQWPPLTLNSVEQSQNDGRSEMGVEFDSLRHRPGALGDLRTFGEIPGVRAGFVVGRRWLGWDHGGP